MSQTLYNNDESKLIYYIPKTDNDQVYTDLFFLNTTTHFYKTLQGGGGR